MNTTTEWITLESSPSKLTRVYNPALHILGFYHKDSETGNHDVVDLRGAIIGREGDVMQYSVLLFGEEQCTRVEYKQVRTHCLNS